MENLIFSHLIENDKYARKVLPYLNEDIFNDRIEKKLFKLIQNYIQKYNTLPTKEILYTEIQDLSSLDETQFKDIVSLVQNLEIDEATKTDWLVDQTEKFIQDRSIHNAIRTSIKILDKDSKLTKEAIPKLLSEALSISFDTSVGHEFIADAPERIELYHRNYDKLPFNIHYLNEITGGGVTNKTLNVCIGGTGTGKTLVMCSMAGANLLDNKNVLYITLEMAQERIAQRIDCNLLDVTMEELVELSKEDYLSKIERVKRTTKGKLIVKEFPTTAAHSGHFRHLINELRIKKNFIPDVIYIDYINICASSRIKAGSGIGSYSYIKSIAEELRGLAIEFDLPIWSATQTNRNGINSSDVSLNDTSESMGLPMTVDFLIALITTEELDEQGLMLIKQLKNRYGDLNTLQKFVVSINRPKMRIFDAPEHQQKDLLDGPIMDRTTFGQEDKNRNKKDFKKFKTFS